MADRYDRMTTHQLEAEAAGRGLDLSGARNNEERAQALRDHDAAQQATVDQAQRNAEAAQARQAEQDAAARTGSGAPQDAAASGDQAQVARSDADQGRQESGATVEQPRSRDQEPESERPRYEREAGRAAPGPDEQGPYDVAPYPSDADRDNRVGAASGTPVVDQGIDTSQAPPVGGQQDLDPDQP
jgi:hypothetical protein